MSAALEKLVTRNRLQHVKTVMKAMVSRGLAEEVEGNGKFRLTPRGRAARRSDRNAVNRDLGEWFQQQVGLT
jgi:predicted transcriptional regulator